MKNHTLFLTIALFFLLSAKISAQSNYPLLAMQVTTTPVSNYLTPDSLENLTEQTVFETHMLFSVYDTSVTRVYIKIGTTNGGSDILSEDFDFNTYRNGYDIDLPLGNLTNMLQYYSEVWLKKSDGTFTTSLSFSRQ
jgi:hypothetical protein